MTIIYAKPAVRNAWADSAVQYNPGTQTGDIYDPGNAFVEAGWLQSTTPPARQYFNWALNWAAAAVRYFMQRGIVDWDTAELYQQNAIVQYSGVVYISLVSGNTGQNPATATAYWGQAFATLANLAATLTSAENFATAAANLAQANAESYAAGQAINAQTNAENYALAQATAAQANSEAYTNTAIPAAFSGRSVQTGYRIDPGGYIECWGLSTFTTTAATILFSSTGLPGGSFSTACFNVQATQVYGGTYVSGGVVSGTVNRSGFNGICSGSSTSFFWRANGL